MKSTWCLRDYNRLLSIFLLMGTYYRIHKFPSVTLAIFNVNI